MNALLTIIDTLVRCYDTLDYEMPRDKFGLLCFHVKATAVSSKRTKEKKEAKTPCRREKLPRAAPSSL